MIGRAHRLAVPPVFFDPALDGRLSWDQPCFLLVILATNQGICHDLAMMLTVYERDGALQGPQQPWVDLPYRVPAIGN